MRIVSVAVLLFLLTSASIATMVRADAATYATYHVTADVSARSAPTSAPTGVYGIPRGAAFGVQCQVIGQPAGPNGNTLYFLSEYAGRVFYIPDTYTDSPHLAGQPPIAGIPMCGSTPAPAPPPPIQGSDPCLQGGCQAPSNAVWIGSPVNGIWAWVTSSLPANHHIVYGGDWSVDLPTGGGQDVILYAAPQYSSLSVTTVVEEVAPACGSGRISDGGYRVAVGIYNGSSKIGRAVYAHINPSVSAGQTISRWGTKLGTVGSYRHDPYGCWDGEHVHFELYSQAHYACFNRGFAFRQAVSRTNFIGYTGGNFANGPRAACP